MLKHFTQCHLNCCLHYGKPNTLNVNIDKVNFNAVLKKEAKMIKYVEAAVTHFFFLTVNAQEA